MKFGVSCEIDSKIYMDRGLEIVDGSKTFIFYVDADDYRLNKVRIISAVRDPSKYFYKKQEGIPAVRFGVDHGYEEEVAEDLIKELQLIESTLGLTGNLKSVKWQKQRFEYYPETTEECERIEIKPAWFFKRDYTPDSPTTLSLENLALIVHDRNKFRNAAVPMAFYREGRNDFQTGRYITAFQNFFYVIEGLFGNGKYKSDALISELSSSQIFSRFVDELIDQANSTATRADGLTREQLEELLGKYSQPYTVAGVVRYLVNERGRLHHFSIGSSVEQGTPFNHFDFKTSSYLVLNLAGQALTYFLDEETKKEENEK